MKTISQFIENQFPNLYKEEAPLFIEFLKTYYEWLELDGNEIENTRKFLSSQDVDTTPDEFLQHFKNKYLFGIPSEILVDPRFLIKHIKDVYNAKGSIQGWKLLFRLLFNEDVEIYLPKQDILTPSDGTWHIPKYIEVADVENLNEYVGKRVIGTSSKTTALVESVISQPLNERIIYQLYISNIIPEGGNFNVGEILSLEENLNTINMSSGPKVLGSPSTLTIISGGQDFAVGNIIQVIDQDPFSKEILTNGKGAKFRVSKVSSANGSIYFDIVKAGTKYSYDSIIDIENNVNDETGQNANFRIGSLTDIDYYTFNTDLLLNYANLALNSSSYGFPLFPNANANTPLMDMLTFITKEYGSIGSLTDIETGKNYTYPVDIKIKNLISSGFIDNISWTTNTNIVQSNSIFSDITTNGSYISLHSNTTSNGHLYYITSISNNSIDLNQLISLPSTANGYIKIYVNPFKSEFSSIDYLEPDGSIKGENAIISGSPFLGKGIITEAVSVESGKGYIDNESVKLYLFSAIQQPTIINGGTGYSNNDLLIFTGGETNYPAKGSIRTNSAGEIIDIIISSFGSNYKSIPQITIKSRNGSGANIETSLGEYNTYTAIHGRINLNGIGSEDGRWTSTKSFLNSDKYIQDSYFYQAYSYQLKASVDLERYKDMLKSIYHPIGNEVFFERLSIDIQSSQIRPLEEVGAIIE